MTDSPRARLRQQARSIARRAWSAWPPLPRLDRWEPRTELTLPRTEVERARFPAIDVHNHLGRWLSRDDGWMAPDVGRLVHDLDELGVEAVVNLDGRFGAELTENLERYDLARPGRFLTFCHLDWALFQESDPTRALLRGLRESADRGARGIKVWKDLGRSVTDRSGRLVLLDDARLRDVWALAGELKLPVLVHSGDPAAFFRPADRHNERLEELRRHRGASWHRAGLPPLARLLDGLETAVRLSPGTTWIGAHLASRVEDLASVDRLLRELPNLTVDIAARAGDLGRQPRAAARLVAQHPDRILFGTDVFPLRPPEVRIYFRLLETADEAFDYSLASVPPAGRWTISGLDLPDDALAAIYAGNARRVLGLPTSSATSP